MSIHMRIRVKTWHNLSVLVTKSLPVSSVARSKAHNDFMCCFVYSSFKYTRFSVRSEGHASCRENVLVMRTSVLVHTDTSTSPVNLVDPSSNISFTAKSMNPHNGLPVLWKIRGFLTPCIGSSIWLGKDSNPRPSHSKFGIPQ